MPKQQQPSKRATKYKPPKAPKTPHFIKRVSRDPNKKKKAGVTKKKFVKGTTYFYVLNSETSQLTIHPMVNCRFKLKTNLLDQPPPVAYLPNKNLNIHRFSKTIAVYRSVNDLALEYTADLGFFVGSEKGKLYYYKLVECIGDLPAFFPLDPTSSQKCWTELYSKYFVFCEASLDDVTFEFLSQVCGPTCFGMEIIARINPSDNCFSSAVEGPDVFLPFQVPTSEMPDVWKQIKSEANANANVRVPTSEMLEKWRQNESSANEDTTIYDDKFEYDVILRRVSTHVLERESKQKVPEFARTSHTEIHHKNGEWVLFVKRNDDILQTGPTIETWFGGQ